MIITFERTDFPRKPVKLCCLLVKHCNSMTVVSIDCDITELTRCLQMTGINEGLKHLCSDSDWRFLISNFVTLLSI